MSHLYKVIHAFNRDPDNIKIKDLTLLSNVPPNKIASEVGISLRQAEDISAYAQDLLNSKLRYVVDKRTQMMGGAISTQTKRPSSGLTEFTEPEDLILDESNIIRERPIPLVEDVEIEVPAVEDEEMDLIGDEDEYDSGDESDIDYIETINWLKDKYPNIEYDANINTVYAALHNFLRDNFMLRLDRFTMTEILNDNTAEIEQFLLDNYGLSV